MFFKKIEDVIDQTILPISQKFGKVESLMIMHWRDIVGEEIAKNSEPCKFTYENEKRTLHLMVQNSSQVLIVTHMSQQIIEKITSFFGFKAIHNIRTKQLR